MIVNTFDITPPSDASEGLSPANSASLSPTSTTSFLQLPTTRSPLLSPATTLPDFGSPSHFTPPVSPSRTPRPHQLTTNPWDNHQWSKLFHASIPPLYYSQQEDHSSSCLDDPIRNGAWEFILNNLQQGLPYMPRLDPPYPPPTHQKTYICIQRLLITHQEGRSPYLKRLSRIYQHGRATSNLTRQFFILAQEFLAPGQLQPPSANPTPPHGACLCGAEREEAADAPRRRPKSPWPRQEPSSSAPTISEGDSTRIPTNYFPRLRERKLEAAAAKEMSRKRDRDRELAEKEAEERARKLKQEQDEDVMDEDLQMGEMRQDEKKELVRNRQELRAVIITKDPEKQKAPQLDPTCSHCHGVLYTYQVPCLQCLPG